MTASVLSPVLPSAVTDQALWSWVLHDPCSQRLVRKMSVQYARCGILEEEDLRQAGQIGLLQAAQRFDGTKRVKFCTYARWWVRAEMASAMEREGRNIRLPASVVESRRLLHRYCLERGWPEALDAAQRVELSSVLGVSLARLQRLLDLDSWSWQESIEEQPEDGVGVVLPDEEAPTEATLIQALDAPEQHASLQAALEVLAVTRPREAEVLAAYYGLAPQSQRENHSQIAARVGLSRERVRQLVQQGVGHLRGLMEEDA